ncbi:hypothetical protein B9Z55_015052 [Caenorhabditis nigoni]|uniref:Uncharacterized protein n=1 Tax=Caenorhabditis nigoni TaxID=1611254 RepID=A0A2G5U8D9_9PELO|nr:hypothetical protein B9Z55_015052 [Caenorhabditis nigoni]
MFPSTNRTNHNSGSSSLIHTRNTFEIEEPSTNTKIWYQWLSIRIRQYMILEIFFVISLIMNLYRLQTISNQNDLVLGTINSMHSRFGNMERKDRVISFSETKSGYQPVGQYGTSGTINCQYTEDYEVSNTR